MHVQCTCIYNIHVGDQGIRVYTHIITYTDLSSPVYQVETYRYCTLSLP